MTFGWQIHTAFLGPGRTVVTYNPANAELGPFSLLCSRRDLAFAQDLG